MKEITIGLLPLFLKLYDDVMGDERKRFEVFYNKIAREFEKRNLKVIRVPICRVKEEFDNAVNIFESQGAEAIVTLHLAYSPSLESIDALSSSKLPVIVCDTTPTYSYGPDQDPGELMYNHGIHGVQDMCNLLLRFGKVFHIEAGHWEKSDVLDRVVSHSRAVRIVSRFRGMKSGLIGEPFKGMGDFYVSDEKLKKDFDITIYRLLNEEIKAISDSVTEIEIKDQIEKQKEIFDLSAIDSEVHKRTIRDQLIVEKWVQKNGIGAFSFNFLNITRNSGFKTVPFLAASSLMSRGVGYGGEGDILTASLVGSVMSVLPEASFTEMFCPDWEGNRIFLSHMGEFNYTLAEGKVKLLEMDYRFGDVENPVYATGRFKPGKIILIDLLPMREGYRLIIAPAEMVAVEGKDNMEKSVHGWFKPGFDGKIKVEDFLKEYSRLGGTHHLAVVYSDDLKLIKVFGEMMGFDTKVIS